MKKTIAILVILVFITSICFADLGDELLQAAEDGDLIEVEKLIEAGADVNLQDEWGNTALSEAVKKGYTEIVEILKNAGAVE
jgi:ankyrin repeat protein